MDKCRLPAWHKSGPNTFEKGKETFFVAVYAAVPGELKPQFRD
jgi:hypothetical protein